VSVYDEGLVDEDERSWTWPQRIALGAGWAALMALFVFCLSRMPL
jgi:hypothetical protein